MTETESFLGVWTYTAEMRKLKTIYGLDEHDAIMRAIRHRAISGLGAFTDFERTSPEWALYALMPVGGKRIKYFG